MGTDDKGLAWIDKDRELSFTVKDCTISGSTLDSLKKGEIYYDTATSESYMGTTTGCKPIKITYDYTITAAKVETITKEQKQIETLIKAVTNLIKEVEELKKDNDYQHEKMFLLEEENKVLRNSMEEMYVEMVAIKDKTIILESRKVDKEPATIETSALASCC